MVQTIAAILIVLVAAVYLVRKLVRQWSGRERASCAFCSDPECTHRKPPPAAPPETDE